MASHKRIQDYLSNTFIALVLLIFVLPLAAFSGTFAGHLVGIAGTVLMLMTLIYPYKKYALKIKGKKNSLVPHIYYGLIGPILVVIHSGSGFKSVIGTILFLSMLLVVLSGITGKFLFGRVNKTFKAREREYGLLRQALESRLEESEQDECELPESSSGAVIMEALGGIGKAAGDQSRANCAGLYDLSRAMAETENMMGAWSTTKKLFSYWRKIHFYLVYVLFAMITVHVISTLYYGLRWLP